MPEPLTAIMAGSAVLSAGATVFGASKQAEGQDKALAAQTEATNKELALKREIFESNKAGAEPWITAGKAALQSLTTKIADGSFDLRGYGMEDLLQDPGYQFRVSEGVRALEGSAAAKGKLLSGDQMGRVMTYGQNMASQEFSNAFARTSAERDREYDRLLTGSTQGLAAQNAMSGVATNYAESAGRTISGQGDAAATAATNTGNIWANAATGVAKSANTGLENWMLYDRLGGM